MQFSYGNTGLYIEMAEPQHAANPTLRSIGRWPLICGSTGAGRYATLDTGPIASLSAADKTELSGAASTLLKEYLCGASRVLVCGLGNSSLTADCLGPSVCRRISLTGDLPGGRALFSFAPGVSAATGIPTAQLVRAAAVCISAEAIVVVDALCARTAARLSSVIQFSDKGLIPGSGTADPASAEQKPEEISAQTMPCPVVSVGIPTIIRTTLPDGGNTQYLVTDSTVDRVIEEGAKILSSAILRTVLSSCRPDPTSV